MNQRIQELKEQAMAWVPNMADPDTKIRLLNAEKFAELIVRECALVAKTLPHTPERHWVQDSVTYIPVHCEQNILKHFGVNSNEITTAMLDTAINQIEEYKKYVAQQQKENLPHISYSSWELYNKPKKEQE